MYLVMWIFTLCADAPSCHLVSWRLPTVRGPCFFWTMFQLLHLIFFLRCVHWVRQSYFILFYFNVEFHGLMIWLDHIWTTYEFNNPHELLEILPLSIIKNLLRTVMFLWPKKKNYSWMPFLATALSKISTVKSCQGYYYQGFFYYHTCLQANQFLSLDNSLEIIQSLTWSLCEIGAPWEIAIQELCNHSQ